MLIDYKTESIKFKVGEFVLFFSTNVLFETFNDPKNFYGVVFFYDKHRFEVMESAIGTRLLISGQNGESRDLPFHLGTAHLLPDFIKVKPAKDSESK